MGRFDSLLKKIPKEMSQLEHLVPSGMNDSDLIAWRKAMSPEQNIQYSNLLDSQYGIPEQRAKDLGFHDQTYYHGTPFANDFDEFKRNDLQNVGPFVTDSPEYALKYTGYAGDERNIMPLKIRGNITDFQSPEALNDYFKTNDFGNEHINKSIKHNFNSGNSWIPSETFARDYLKNKNAEIIHTTENRDFIDRDRKKISKVNNNFEVVDPAAIRSTDAKFDPRYKDSKYRLAGIGAIGGTAGPSLIEEGAKKVGQFLQTPTGQKIQQYGSQALDTDPGLGLPTLRQALRPIGKAGELLNIPVEKLAQFADYATGGTGEERSFAKPMERFSKLLPESMQNSGAARDVGYLTDMGLNPLGAVGGVLGKMGKTASVLSKEVHNVEEIGKMIKRPYKNFGDTAVLKTAQEAAEDAQKLAMQKGAEQYLAKQEARKAAKSMPNQVSTQLSAFDQWVTQNPGKSKQDYLSEMLSKK